MTDEERRRVVKNAINDDATIFTELRWEEEDNEPTGYYEVRFYCPRNERTNLDDVAKSKID